jgi:acyl dehydratase
MAGLYFDAFQVGRVFRHEIRRTVTETDNVLFSAMTHNPAAISTTNTPERLNSAGR